MATLTGQLAIISGGLGDIGRACAILRGWPGARINQDNVIWKPPATAALGFHQDDSY